MTVHLAESLWFLLCYDGMDESVRARIIRLYYASGCSPTATLRAYKKETGERYPPCTEGGIRNVVKKFEASSTIQDLPKSGRHSGNGDRALTVSGAVEELKSENDFGICSVRQVAEASKIPKSSVHRIMRNDLHLKPYRPQFVQELFPADFQKRLEFVDLMTEKFGSDFSDILFTDEAHFHLSGEVSSLTGAVWDGSNPQIRIPKPLHSSRLTVWVGLNRRYVIPPYFFDGSVTSASYLEMLESHCIPFLKSKRIMFRTIFQQDGAPPHIGKEVKLCLQKNFKDRVISRHFDFHWPARSPDITPLDFWFWGHVKKQVYKKRMTSLVELKGRITDVCTTIDQEMLARVIDYLPNRLHQLKLNKGRQLT